MRGGGTTEKKKRIFVRPKKRLAVSREVAKIYGKAVNLRYAKKKPTFEYAIKEEQRNSFSNVMLMPEG